jgi:RimJ/RimL family protein N-acetyltransferase
MLITKGPEIVMWVHLQLNQVCPDTNLAQGLGFVEQHRPWRICGGVVYSNWNGFDIETSIALSERFRLTRPMLRAIFAYPFQQLGASRMTARIECTNERSKTFVQRLGFSLEATLSEACKAGDLLIYRMFRRDCGWIK